MITRIAVLVLAGVAASGCALHRQPRVTDHGIPPCPEGADRDLLSSDALQCWFTAPHGRWRVLNHQSHLEALVVDVEARDLDDAAGIARGVVASADAAYSEVLVYVRSERDGEEVRVRRVRWTPDSGFETLDFSTGASDSPLTIQSRPGQK